MELLTAEELRARLKLETAKAAKRLMLRWGVEPFSLGVGRGLGDRYDWAEVEEALQSLRKKKKPAAKPRAQKSKGNDAAAFFEQSWNDVKKDLTGAKSLH